MADTTNLYLLIFPKHGVVKVGKADDINQRIQTLKRWWGDVDYDESYYLTSSTEVILRLEKSLHFFLSSYAVSFSEGDGRTELFSTPALDVALRHIEILCASALNIEPLRKGVPRLLATSSRLKMRRGTKYRALVRKSASVHSGITRIAEKFHRINRLLLILLRKQSRLAYQYDMIGNHIYFRLRLPRSERVQEDSFIVMSYFSFRIDDFFGSHGVNCCSSAVGIDDVIQLNIRKLVAVEDDPISELFSYFFRQSEHILKRLPQRSSAAVEPIAIID